MKTISGFAKKPQLKVDAAMQRNIVRPSREFPISMTPRFDESQNRNAYDCSYSGIFSSGASPEEACQNFDRVWRDGEHE